MGLLLCFNPLTSLSPPSSFLSSTLSITASPISRLCIKPINEHPRLNSLNIVSPIITHKTVAIIVKASADIDGTPPTDNGELLLSESKEDKVVPIDKLPLESKVQEKLDQKMRMKMVKKIRLRRKRLVRKRRMRKKGRWPPSKMKKLKNV